MKQDNEVRCRRCHRPLRTEECRLVGFGKTCWKKMFNQPFPTNPKERLSAVQNLKKDDEEEEPPLFNSKFFEQ